MSVREESIRRREKSVKPVLLEMERTSPERGGFRLKVIFADGVVGHLFEDDGGSSFGASIPLKGIPVARY